MYGIAKGAVIIALLFNSAFLNDREREKKEVFWLMLV